MNYNISALYYEFERVKSQVEYLNYCKEIEENSSIINSMPFDCMKAKLQIARLTQKYKDELNLLAKLYNNGMDVVEVAPDRNEYRLKAELKYLNNQIPIIAIIREQLKNAFKTVGD